MKHNRMTGMLAVLAIAGVATLTAATASADGSCRRGGRGRAATLPHRGTVITRTYVTHVGPSFNHGTLRPSRARAYRSTVILRQPRFRRAYHRPVYHRPTYRHHYRRHYDRPVYRPHRSYYKRRHRGHHDNHRGSDVTVTIRIK
ncbi:MAG: hypothetical protein ACLFVU_12520 [Phycisphaerae bacterium]